MKTPDRKLDTIVVLDSLLKSLDLFWFQKVKGQGHRVYQPEHFRTVAESTMKNLYHCQYLSTLMT